MKEKLYKMGIYLNNKLIYKINVNAYDLDQAREFAFEQFEMVAYAEEIEEEKTKKSTRYFLELEYFDKNNKCFISYESGCYDDRIFDSYDKMVEYVKNNLYRLKNDESLACYEEKAENEKWSESEVEYMGSFLKNENIYNEE